MTTRRKITQKRKRRGSLRLDRLAIVLTPVVLVIAAAVFFSLRACNDDVPADQVEEVHVAIGVSEAAARDAAAVEITPAGSMERQQALLDIHVRASRMKAAGFIHAADEYLNLINSRLREKGIL